MTSIRPLFLLLFVWLAACSSAPTKPAETAPTTEEPAATGGELGALPAEEVIKIEREVTDAPPAPEGCQIIDDNPNVWMLMCGNQQVNVSRSEFRAPEKVTADLSIDSQVEELRAAGFQLEKRGDVQLTDAIHGRAYDAVIDQKATIFAGLRAGAEDYYRAALCRLDAGQVVAESRCAERIAFLAKHADANRAVGISIYGKTRSFPEECRLADRGVFCGQNGISWTMVQGADPSTALTEVFGRIESVMQGRGAESERIANECSFDGTSIPCNELHFNLPGYAKQSVIVAVLPAQDGSVALICDSITPGSATLPSPCGDVFSASRSKK